MNYIFYSENSSGGGPCSIDEILLDSNLLGFLKGWF
jgi:hypothetical protein